MMMQPFENGGLKAWFTLTRVWCVFELFACELTQSIFEITMTEEMHSRLFGGGYEAYQEVMSSLDAIDTEDSESVEPQDKDRVFEVIRKSVGFKELNLIVKKKVKEFFESKFRVGF